MCSSISDQNMFSLYWTELYIGGDDGDLDPHIKSHSGDVRSLLCVFFFVY